MEKEAIQAAVQKFLTITSRYGMEYQSLEDTYLPMPFYEIFYSHGEYILPTKKPNRIEESDIDELQSDLNDFLNDFSYRKLDAKRAQDIIDHVDTNQVKHPKDLKDVQRTLARYSQAGYYFTDGEYDAIDLASTQHLMSQGHVRLRVDNLEAIDPLAHYYYYQDKNVFNLKRPDVLVPLSSIGNDIQPDSSF